MVLVKGDKLGCSKSTTFSISLKDPNCTPVCHTLRNYSKVKSEFID